MPRSSFSTRRGSPVPGFSPYGQRTGAEPGRLWLGEGVHPGSHARNPTPSPSTPTAFASLLPSSEGSQRQTYWRRVRWSSIFDCPTLAEVRSAPRGSRMSPLALPLSHLALPLSHLALSLTHRPYLRSPRIHPLYGPHRGSSSNRQTRCIFFWRWCRRPAVQGTSQPPTRRVSPSRTISDSPHVRRR